MYKETSTSTPANGEEIHRVAVYAASSRQLAEEYTEAAAQVGRVLAHAGMSIVYGGGGTGLMGAVFGLLLAYGVTWPENRVLLLFFPVPIKAKWFVLIYGGIELIFGITNAMPQIAHFAHLGGLLFGAGLLWRWGWRPGMTWKR